MHLTITKKEDMKAAPAMLKAHPDKKGPDMEALWVLHS
jgi:hypothetical protein